MPLPAPDVTWARAAEQIIGGFYRLAPATMPNAVTNAIIDDYYDETGGPAMIQDAGDPPPAPRPPTMLEKKKWFVRHVRDDHVFPRLCQKRRTASVAAAAAAADIQFAIDVPPPVDD